MGGLNYTRLLHVASWILRHQTTVLYAFASCWIPEASEQAFVAHFLRLLPAPVEEMVPPTENGAFRENPFDDFLRHMNAQQGRKAALQLRIESHQKVLFEGCHTNKHVDITTFTHTYHIYGNVDTPLDER